MSAGGRPSTFPAPLGAIHTARPVRDFSCSGTSIDVLSADGTVQSTYLDGRVGAVAPAFRASFRMPGAVRLVRFESTLCAIDAAGDAQCEPSAVSSSVSRLRGEGPLRELIPDSHCAILRDDRLVCAFSAAPHTVLPNVRQASIAHESSILASPLGALSGCAVQRDGSTYCWGSDSTAAPRAPERQTPTLVAGLPPSIEVSVSDRHACALTRDGSVYCWGATGMYQSGPAARAQLASLPGCAIDQAATDQARAAARAFNHQRCPIVPPGGDDLCGRTHWAAGRADENAVIYHRERLCAVSDADRQYALRAVRVDAVHDAVEVRVADNESCALQRDGRVVCWGNNQQAPFGIVLPPVSQQQPMDVLGSAPDGGVAPASGR